MIRIAFPFQFHIMTVSLFGMEKINHPMLYNERILLDTKEEKITDRYI